LNYDDNETSIFCCWILNKTSGISQCEIKVQYSIDPAEQIDIKIAEYLSFRGVHSIDDLNDTQSPQYTNSGSKSSNLVSDFTPFSPKEPQIFISNSYLQISSWEVHIRTHSLPSLPLPPKRSHNLFTNSIFIFYFAKK